MKSRTPAPPSPPPPADDVTKSSGDAAPAPGGGGVRGLPTPPAKRNNERKGPKPGGRHRW